MFELNYLLYQLQISYITKSTGKNKNTLQYTRKNHFKIMHSIHFSSMYFFLLFSQIEKKYIFEHKRLIIFAQLSPLLWDCDLHD